MCLVYGATGSISTMQSTLDSSQFGSAPGGGTGAVNIVGMGIIDTTNTTDNNSSHDGSEENNDQLPMPPSHNANPWNLASEARRQAYLKARPRI